MLIFNRLKARKVRRGTLAVRTALSSTELQKRVQALEVAGAIEVRGASYPVTQLSYLCPAILCGRAIVLGRATCLDLRRSIIHTDGGNPYAPVNVSRARLGGCQCRGPSSSGIGAHAQPYVAADRSSAGIPVRQANEIRAIARAVQTGTMED